MIKLHEQSANNRSSKMNEYWNRSEGAKIKGVMVDLIGSGRGGNGNWRVSIPIVNQIREMNLNSQLVEYLRRNYVSKYYIIEEARDEGYDTIELLLNGSQRPHPTVINKLIDLIQEFIKLADSGEVSDSRSQSTTSYPTKLPEQKTVKTVGDKTVITVGNLRSVDRGVVDSFDQAFCDDVRSNDEVDIDLKIIDDHTIQITTDRQINQGAIEYLTSGIYQIAGKL